MPLRKLLLPLTESPAGEAALATGLMVGRRFLAHLEALHIAPDRSDFTLLAGEGLSGAMLQDMIRASEQEGARRGQAARAMFEQFIARHGVREGRPGSREATASFAIAGGREDETIAHRARLSDLTVVRHPEALSDAGGMSSSDALHTVLFDSGRPVLISPPTPPPSIGTRICVAWSGTAEAAAALHAVLPWLMRADAVRLLVAPEYYRNGPREAEVLDYLTIYDVRPDVAVFRPLDRDVGAGLLTAARDWRADLLAMGAYSHSRLRQLILGGVTRHVLEHADLPVLMNR